MDGPVVVFESVPYGVDLRVINKNGDLSPSVAKILSEEKFGFLINPLPQRPYAVKASPAILPDLVKMGLREKYVDELPRSLLEEEKQRAIHIVSSVLFKEIDPNSKVYIKMNTKSGVRGLVLPPKLKVNLPQFVHPIAAVERSEDSIEGNIGGTDEASLLGSDDSK